MDQLGPLYIVSLMLELALLKVTKGDFILTHSLRVASIMSEKFPSQEPEAAGHFASVVSKPRGMNADIFFSCSFPPGSQSVGEQHLQAGWIFPPALTLSRIVLTDMERVLSPG